MVNLCIGSGNRFDCLGCVCGGFTGSNFGMVAILNRLLILLLLIVVPDCCSVAQAQIKLQPEYSVGQPVIVEVQFPDVPEGAVPADLVWEVGDAGYKPLTANSIAVWPSFGNSDKRLQISVYGGLVTADGKYVPKSNRKFEASSLLKGIDGQPTPPPGPKPDPIPVPDGTNPFGKLTGFRAAIVYETGDKYTIGQTSAMFGADVVSYLNSKTAKGADGKTLDWRRLDPQQPATGVWADLLKRERKSMPWLILSNGSTWYEGPVPESDVKMLELLKKYGG